MSSTFSAGSAVSASGLSEPECERSRSARSTRSAAASSRSTGRMSPAIPMSASSPPTASEQMALPLMSSAEASPARTSASPERARALRGAAAAYGRSTPDLLASFDPATSSWRTLQRCLVEGWTVFSETWPRSGLMRNGIAYALPTLAPLTSETDCGLWPTPMAGDGAKLDATIPAIRRRIARGRHIGLAMQARLWPTPTARDFRHPGRSRMERTGGTQGECLPQAIGGALNPTWVEWLMGFPLGWTALEGSATPSSRRSRKSSGEQS